MATIMSVGSINADFQVRVDALPHNGEMAMGREFARLSSGTGPNVARAAQLLGFGTQVLGMVGDDDLADQALGPLRRANVDVSHVRVAHGHATAVATNLVMPDGSQHKVFAPNASAAWSDDDLTAARTAIDALAPDDVLVVSCDISAAAVTCALQAAARRGLRVVLDPVPGDRVSTRAVRKLWAHVSAVMPDDTAASRMSGVSVSDDNSAARAAQVMHARGVALACVRRAHGGCVAVFDGNTLFVAPQPVTIVDTSGADDAFAGALAVALAEERGPLDAVLFAAAAAHLALTRYGAQASCGERDEVEAMQATLRPLARLYR